MISVIVPIFNCEKTLSRCLDSILVQTYTNLEIICINDGSTDNSLKILRNYELKDNRIRVINKENEGVSKTRNIGLECCSGEYVLFVDADDYISDEMIEKLFEAIGENYDVVVSGYTEINNEESIEIFDYKHCENKNDFLLRCIDNTGGVVCSKMYRTSIVKDNIILFDESLSLSEDLIFALQVFLKADKIISLNRADYFYDRRNEGNKSINIDERLSNNFEIQDRIERLLENQNIEGKEYALNKRLSNIVYVYLLNIVNKNDYNKFKETKKNIDNRIRKLSFDYFDIFNNAWLSLYKRNHLFISFILCKFRMLIVSLIKKSKRKSR